VRLPADTSSSHLADRKFHSRLVIETTPRSFWPFGDIVEHRQPTQTEPAAQRLVDQLILSNALAGSGTT
jgi:hypothetical protein